MTCRTVLALITIIALAGCIQGTPDTPDNEIPDDQPDAGDNTIIFDGTSFSPQDLTITVGETVTWKAQGTDSMWVASNQHPTHQEYDGTSLDEHCTGGTSNAFDQCSTGTTYTFTFNQPGQWSYHNHQPFAPGGTITVQETPG